MRHGRWKWLVCMILIVLLAACGSAPDEEVPHLTMDETPPRTNEAALTVGGTVEAGATLQVQTTAEPQPIAVEPFVEGDETLWSADVTLQEGTNRISVIASDRVGNSRIVHRTIVLDTQAANLSEWRWEETGNLLVIVFDKLVKVDTLVGREDGETFVLTDLVEGRDIAGTLSPDIKEGEDSPEYWRSFIWAPEDSWTPGEAYSFSIPRGVADDLGNVTDSEIVVTFLEEEEEDEDETPDI